MSVRWMNNAAWRRFHLVSSGTGCEYCGRTFAETLVYEPNGSGRQATIEHKQPKSRGGSHHKRENIAIVCRDCNELKGHLTLAEFEAAVAWAVFCGFKPKRFGGGGHLRQLRQAPYGWYEAFSTGQLRLGPAVGDGAASGAGSQRSSVDTPRRLGILVA